jgi:cell wall-associated NlpC family hydrolase
MLKEGFDCSGFIVWLFQVVGILHSGDWSAQQLHDQFLALGLNKDHPATPGDLAFYGINESLVSHVMLCMDAEHVIGASGGGHETKTRADAEKIGASVHTRNALYRKDFLGFAHVTYPDET